jgi:ABC-type Na+ efflux pump permease subunit
MLRDALYLARVEFVRLLRLRETVVWTLVMPTLFMYFVGSVMANSLGRPDSPDPIGVFIPQSAGPMANNLLAQLTKRGFQVVRADDARDLDRFRRRLRVPERFTATIESGAPVSLDFDHSGNDLTAAYDQLRLLAAVRNLPALRSGRSEVTLDVQAAGNRGAPPTGFQQSVPGTMVMFTMFALFGVGAVSLTFERNQGILLRLATTPMTRGAVVLGMTGARLGIGLLQIGYAMCVGTLLFHVRWPHLPAVLLVLAVYAALATMFGMLLGNYCRTDGQAIGFGMIISNVLAGLGGCWWPIEIAPQWSQKLAIYMPTGLTMDALHRLMSFHAAPSTVLPHVAAMVAVTLVAAYALAKSFRFH